MKRFVEFSISTLLLVGVLTLVPRVSSAQASADRHAEVQRLEAEAKAAGDRGELHKSYGLWLRAWQLHPSFDIAANLAVVEIQLKLWPEAAEHYAYALQRIPVATPAEKQERLRARLALAKQEVLTLRLRVEPRQAEVRIGSKPSILAGTLAEEIYVEPGTVTVIATLAGHKRYEAVVQGTRGEERAVVIQLVAEESRAVDSAPRPTLSPPKVRAASPAHRRHVATPRPWWPAAAAGIGAAAGLAIGIGFTLGANADERKHASLPPGSSTQCGVGSPVSSCTQLKELASDVARQRDIATGAFVIAGVFASTGLAYWFWPRSAPKSVQGAIGFDGNAAIARVNGRF